MKKNEFKTDIEIELKKYGIKDEELLNLKYTNPLKKEKNINILGKNIKLTNSNYGYSYIQNILKHKNEYVELMVKHTVVYSETEKYTKYEFEKVFKEISKYCYILIYAYLDNFKTIKQEKVINLTNDLMQIIKQFCDDYMTKDTALSNRVSSTLSQYEQKLNSAKAKAIGSEAGVLYGPGGNFSAMVGTKLVSATYDVDCNNAREQYDLSMSIIKKDYERTVIVESKKVIEKMSFCLLRYFFEEEFTTDEFEQIELNYSKEEGSKELFIKYPFIINNYVNVINELSEKDSEAFVEVVTFYKKEDDLQEILLRLIYEKYNTYIKNKKIEDIYSKYFEIYCMLKDEKANDYLSQFLIDYFKHKIIMILPCKETRNFEFQEMLENVNLFEQYIGKQDRNIILRTMNEKYKCCDQSELKNSIKKAYTKNLLSLLILFVIIFVFQIINNDLITFGSVCKNLFVSGLLSLGITLLFSYLLCYFSSYKEVDWEKENFKFTYESFNKLRKKISIGIIIIIVLLCLLITNGNSDEKQKALNIYNKLFEEDSRFSNDYLYIGNNGLVKYAIENRTGAKYTTYEYKCNITEGDERKLEKYGSYYKHYYFTCEYDSNKFNFEISASYEKGDANRYTIYKKEPENYIPGSIGTFGDGFKESINDFDFNRYK